jgi:transposase-like protein
MRQASKRIPDSAEKTVRDIRRNTRRHHSAEEKIRIVLEGLRGEVSIAELCRKEGINQNLYYRWSKEFLEADALPRFAAASSLSKFCARLTPRPVSSSALKQFRRVLSQAEHCRDRRLRDATSRQTMPRGLDALRGFGSGFYSPRAKNLRVTRRAVWRRGL